MKFSRVSDSHDVNNLERVSLLPLKRLQNPILTILRQCLGPPRN